MRKIKLTCAEAIIKFLSAQKVMLNGKKEPLVAGTFGIFGHGNVAGLGEALYRFKEVMPSYRGHNEQSMAFAAIAYGKAHNRKRLMAVTSSIGPGATNMVTACALAHVNRLPVLFLPGDIFASRSPDPVLQQVENFPDGTISANDCFRPISNYFDRLMRPEQLLRMLPRAVQTLVDPEHCGPVTLSLPQDVQSMAYEFPESFFAEKVHHTFRPSPDERQFKEVLGMLKEAKRPVIVAGGGVLYSEATEELSSLSEILGAPVCETQAGKGTLAFDHEMNVGGIGVTGSEAANHLIQKSDLVLGVGTRFSDFTTGSGVLVGHQTPLISLNIHGYDAQKYDATPLRCDAKVGLQRLLSHLENLPEKAEWLSQVKGKRESFKLVVEESLRAKDSSLPSDSEVLGGVRAALPKDGTIVCAAGGLPGELHKVWPSSGPGTYHVEYGYSCMGYEIAGGLGVKMAHPEREVCVVVGDGSYLMLNSEIATSVMLGKKLIIVVLDNGGFGCINRLQNACGSESFLNRFDDCHFEESHPEVDFVAHAKSLGADGEFVDGIRELSSALIRARESQKTYVISLKTDPFTTTGSGGHWWEVTPTENPETEKQKIVSRQYNEMVDSRI